MAGQGPHERGGAAIHVVRSFGSLQQDGSLAVDEVPQSAVDQRKIADGLEYCAVQIIQNNGQQQYIDIHLLILRRTKLRNIYRSISCTYTLDVFLNCTHIYFEQSPSILKDMEPIPMAENAALEPTFADMMEAIAAATDLPEQTRRHWRSSLAGIAKAFDQPPELIPARFSAVRARMAALHHVPLTWTAKTLANHRSNAKAALIWFANEKEVLPNGIALSPAWDRLRAQLTDPSSRYRLLPLMRFCSGIHIEPDAVDEAVIDRYMDHRTRTTTRPSDAASRRILARLWNAGIGNIDGWPTMHLVEPPVKAAEGPVWEDFPEGLREDVERYLTGLRGDSPKQAGTT